MVQLHQIINCQIKDWFRISELQSDAKINGLSKCGIAFNFYMKVPKGKTGTGNGKLALGRPKAERMKSMELSGGQSAGRPRSGKPNNLLYSRWWIRLVFWIPRPAYTMVELFTVYVAGKQSWLLYHEPEVAQMCKKTAVLRDGNIEHKEAKELRPFMEDIFVALLHLSHKMRSMLNLHAGNYHWLVPSLLSSSIIEGKYRNTKRQLIGGSNNTIKVVYDKKNVIGP